MPRDSYMETPALRCSDSLSPNSPFQMKDRVAKFEKFIKENEAKRRRAIQKYHTEVKLKEQKNREYDMLVEQLEELKAR